MLGVLRGLPLRTTSRAALEWHLVAHICDLSVTAHLFAVNGSLDVLFFLSQALDVSRCALFKLLHSIYLSFVLTYMVLLLMI